MQYLCQDFHCPDSRSSSVVSQVIVFFQQNLDAGNMKGKFDFTRRALVGLCHHHRLPNTGTPRSTVLKTMVAYEYRSHKNDLLLMSFNLIAEKF